MEIKTKYNIGDTVWCIHEFKTRFGLIEQIHFSQWPNRSKTLKYQVKFSDCRKDIEEKYLFSSEEELLKSL